MRTGLYLLLAVIALPVTSPTAASSTEQSVTFRIGYIEGGRHIGHDLLLKEFERQLENLMADDTGFAFVPYGFRTASWHRDSCKIMASSLAQVDGLDLIVAMGPWVVEDLLAAGCTTPILAMYRFVPRLEGIAFDNSRPIADNLSLLIKPDRLARDLAAMTALMPVKRIGFLFFPSGNESENVVQALTNLAARQGIEVESEAGYNTKGAYAFFKSYGRLSRDVDIVYLGPMWAMDGSKLTEFFRMLNRSGTPTFVAEGKLLVNKGAVAANTGVSMFGDAYFHARNALEILRGHIPADLPTEFSPPNGLSLNESAARACKLEIARSITDEAIIVPAPPDDTLEYYSIAYCVSRALLQNPGFLSRNDALEAAQQAAQLAGAIWLPHIDGELIATYFDDNAANNALPRLQNEGYSSSLRLRQTLFSLDAVSSMRVARSQQKLEEASLDESRLDLELAVSLAYLDLLNATNLATITRQFRDFVDRQVEVASVKADLGNYERLDVFRLDDEREKATARLNLALSEARIARAMLNALLNLPAETNYVVDTSLFIPDRMLRDYNLLYSPVVSDPAIEALVQFVYDDAQLQDPSLARYDRRLDLQKAMLSKNRARYWPTLSFEAAFRFDDRLADDLPTFEERNSSWSLSGRLRLPLFSGTERAHEHARLSADFSRLEYERDEASLKLMGRTEQLVRRMIAYVRSTPNVRRSAELAVRYFESVRLRYEASDAGLIELLDALDNVYQTAVNDLTNRHRLLTAMAKTVRQAGWSVSTGSGSFDTEFSKRIRERFGR